MVERPFEDFRVERAELLEEVVDGAPEPTSILARRVEDLRTAGWSKRDRLDVREHHRDRECHAELEEEFSDDPLVDMLRRSIEFSPPLKGNEDDSRGDDLPVQHNWDYVHIKCKK